jgi:hypothetical protein
MIKSAWFKKLAPPILSLALTLVMLEGLLRAFYPAPTYGRVQGEERNAFFAASDWIMRPQGNLDQLALGEYGIRYRVQTNEDGLRNLGLTREKPPGMYRILALGDSFTFGMSASNAEAYPTRLELCLQAAGLWPQVQVANAGFQGFSQDGAYVFYQQLGRQYDPDLILLNVFVQNDWQDLLENDWVAVDERGLPLRLKSTVRYLNPETHTLRFLQRPINYRTPLLRDLHLYQWFYYLAYTPPGDNYQGLAPARIVSSPYHVREAWNAASEQAFALSLRLIGALHEQAIAEGRALLVALLPSGQHFTDESPWVAATPLDSLNPQAAYRQALEAMGIPYVDLLGAFAPYDVLQTYLSSAAHWTALGNEVAGGAVCQYLIANEQFR